jgi:hypothetical protein
MRFYGPNRVACSALEEMREHLKRLNHFTLRRYKNITSMMIEELQTHFNNMEAGLSDWDDVQTLRLERRKLRKEVKQLRNEKKIYNDSENDDD